METSMRRSIPLLTTLVLTAAVGAAHAKTSPTALCEAAIEGASGKYAACRLTAEATYAKKPDAAKRTASLLKCQGTLDKAFTKTLAKYGAACPATEPETSFDSYTTQCSNDLTAAAGGASLADYPGEIAQCDADLDGCNANLTTAQGALASCAASLAACQANPPAATIETGQTTCANSSGSVIACTGTGQDGDLQRGLARSYTDNGDGTITDHDTGLMWEKLSDDGSIHDKDTVFTWDNAFATKVATLNSGAFAGYTDWRVPNAFELHSITNLATATPAVSAVFNTGCVASCTVTTCSCTQAGNYWTSSSVVSGLTAAWLVSFGDGGQQGGFKGNGFYVRAVRAGA